MSAEKPLAGIHVQSLMEAPCSPPKPRLCVSVPITTIIAIAHEATTAQIATQWMSF